jgi:hypothetical protein
MSPRRHWASPNPSLASECAPPPEPGGGGVAHSPAGEGLGGGGVYFQQLFTHICENTQEVAR